MTFTQTENQRQTPDALLTRTHSPETHVPVTVNADGTGAPPSGRGARGRNCTCASRARGAGPCGGLGQGPWLRARSTHKS